MFFYACTSTHSLPKTNFFSKSNMKVVFPSHWPINQSEPLLVASPGITKSPWLLENKQLSQAIEEELDGREGKGRSSWLGDVLECHTSHLAARMIWTKVIRRTNTSILGGWWFGVVWTGRSSIFPKHAFRHVSIFQFIHFFKSSWR